MGLRERKEPRRLLSFGFEQQNEGWFDGRIRDHTYKCMLIEYIMANIYFN